VYHLSVSPARGDNLSEADWGELAYNLVEQLNLKKNQAFGVIHRDTKYPDNQEVRPHLHLVVNAVNYESKCANFYYDYFRVEEILRRFEQKRQLKSLKEYMDRDKNDIPKNNVSPELSDNLLALETIEEAAEKILTREPVINGLDAAYLGIVSATTLIKATLALKENIQKKEEIEKLDLASDFDEIETRAMELVKQEQYTDDEDFTLKAESIKETNVEEFVQKAKVYLKTEELKLTPVEVDKSQSIKESKQAEEIYERFLNSIESYKSLKNDFLSGDYSIQGKQLNVELKNLPGMKEIKIDSKFQAKFNQNRNKWVISLNNLTQEDIATIDNLPQTKEEVVKKALATQLGKHIFEELKNKKEIPWKYSKNEKEENTYMFSYQNSEKNAVLIEGKKNDNQIIFAAKVYNNGLTEIVQNDIPFENLKNFHSWKKKEKERKKKTKNKTVKRTG
jgi:hypothetical protein